MRAQTKMVPRRPNRLFQGFGEPATRDGATQLQGQQGTTYQKGLMGRIRMESRVFFFFLNLVYSASLRRFRRPKLTNSYVHLARPPTRRDYLPTHYREGMLGTCKPASQSRILLLERARGEVSSCKVRGEEGVRAQKRAVGGAEGGIIG